MGEKHFSWICWSWLMISMTSHSFAEEHITGAPWSTSVENTTHVARQTGRPLLVYVTTTHCGYCRKMASESWADPRVDSLVRSRFVPLQLDAEHHANLLQRLGVRAFPTTLVFSPTGANVAKFEGYLPPGRLLQKLRDYDEAGSGSR